MSLIFTDDLISDNSSALALNTSLNLFTSSCLSFARSSIFACLASFGASSATSWSSLCTKDSNGTATFSNSLKVKKARPI